MIPAGNGIYKQNKEHRKRWVHGQTEKTFHIFKISLQDNSLMELFCILTASVSVSWLWYLLGQTGRRVSRYLRSLCITSYNCLWIYSYRKTQSSIKQDCLVKVKIITMMTQQFYSSISREMKIHVHSKTYTWIFTAELFIKANKCGGGNTRLLTDERISKMWHVHTMKYLTIQRTEPWYMLQHENIMLCERSQL